jgi:type VI secretion system protein ImpC
MAEAQANPQTTTQYAPAPRTSLDDLVDRGMQEAPAEAKPRSRELVEKFVRQVLKGDIARSGRTEALIDERIRQIDELLSRQVTEILHEPAFQKLEASWRGLQYLVNQTENGPLLKVKVLHATRDELLEDFEANPSFDQSSLFKKVYESGYGTFGGVPFGAIVGDYYFGKGSQDVKLLTRLAGVAATAHAPFLTAPSPTMFNQSSFSQLSKVVSLASAFEGTDSAKWNSFRESEDSRYVAMALPRVLMREPYGPETVPAKTFNYDEAVDGKRHDQYLWGNAAYALGANVTKAFALHGWCASIRGVENGGLVEGLAVHNFTTEAGELSMKCPTEVQLPDRREKEFAELGFAALVHEKGTDRGAFFSVQSAQKPKKFAAKDKAANASAVLSAQLPYVFSASRFAHYLKVMMRKKVGSNMPREEIETFLNNWIQDYVSVPDAPAMLKSRQPLSEARIDVVEVPGKPGAYRAVAFLKPHYQLDELSIAMRLVADLPAAKGG